MKTTKLASLACALEGKKSQVKVGDMREAISCIGAVLAQMPDCEYLDTLEYIHEAGKKKLIQLSRKQNK